MSLFVSCNVVFNLVNEFSQFILSEHLNITG